MKLHTKRGFLTAYGHACGYLDVANIGNDRNAITMGRDGLYFVRVAPAKDRAQVWECFDGPTCRSDARRFFMAQVKKHGARRVLPGVRS